MPAFMKAFVSAKKYLLASKRFFSADITFVTTYSTDDNFAEDCNLLIISAFFCTPLSFTSSHDEKPKEISKLRKIRILNY